MHIDDIPPDVATAAQTLPKFGDGRIDYTHATIAPVLNVFVTHDNHLLLVHRSDKVGWLKNCWHIVGGFLDEEVSLRHKLLEELREEIGVELMDVKNIHLIAVVKQTDHHKCWIVHEVAVELHRRSDIVLDWENTEFAWVTRENLDAYALLPEVRHVALSLLRPSI